METDSSNLEDDTGGECEDLRDIEFKLMHNLNDLEVILW